ncbi:MAG: DUF2934 domain-containing protein [Lacunisphaera sp.]
MNPNPNFSATNPLRDEIERLAYSFFERDSRRDGHDLEHWLCAEAQLAPNQPFNATLKNPDVPSRRSSGNHPVRPTGRQSRKVGSPRSTIA